MSKTLYWFQGSACGGDTFSLLGVELPNLCELLEMLDVEVLWQPSLSNGTPSQHHALLEAICHGEQKLDILCVEGAIVRGPGGTGFPKRICLRDWRKWLEMSWQWAPAPVSGELVPMAKSRPRVFSF